MFRSSRPAVLAVAVVVLLASVSTPVLAQDDSTTDWQTETYAALETGVALYNDNIDSVDLGPAEGQLTNKNVNLYIANGSESAVFSFRMDGDARIVQLADEPRDDASLKMTTDTATIERIANADNPARAFRNAVANDDIVIAGERGHPVEQVTWIVINALKGLFFGGA